MSRKIMCSCKIQGWVPFNSSFRMQLLPAGSWLCVLSHFSCVQLCDAMNCSPPGSSVRRILQARMLEQVAISFSSRSFQPRDWISVSYVSYVSFFITRTTWETPNLINQDKTLLCSLAHPIMSSKPQQLRWNPNLICQSNLHSLTSVHIFNHTSSAQFNWTNILKYLLFSKPHDGKQRYKDK